MKLFWLLIHFFRLSVFFPSHLLIYFFSVLDSGRTEEKEKTDGGRKKSERREKDEK
jgi:hypothetical protein